MTETAKRAVKSRNAKLENLARYGTRKDQHKKWKYITQELSDRHISLSDIANPDSPKQMGLTQMINNDEITLGEMVMLQQYAEAIENRSTKAAEFIRDTMGEKPSTQLDVNDVSESGISQMSLEDLIALKELLEKQNKES